MSIVGELGMDWLVWSEYWKLIPKCNYFQGQGSKSSIPLIIILHISSLTYPFKPVAWKLKARKGLTNHWVKLQSRKLDCITLYFFYQYKSNVHKLNKNLPDLPDAITLRLIIMKNHFRSESKFKYQQSSHKQ